MLENGEAAGADGHQVEPLPLHSLSISLGSGGKRGLT